MGDFPVASDDLALGAIETGGGNVRFALYAPQRKSVHLVGDFNDWNRQADALSPRDDGVWMLDKPLGVGGHDYQFIIDGRFAISDPYARAVRYDDRKDTPAISRVEVGRPAFAWSHESWDRPLFQDLIIYELAVADFSPTGDLRGVIERLDHLRNLGVRAIELMPIFGFSTRSGWGYDPTHFFAIHPPYGSADDLRELVDQCHGRGIAVILDAVLAHTGVEHPFTRLYDLRHSPWYSHSLTKKEQLFGLPTLDYNRPAARRFATDVLTYWTREFHIDGYRLDYLSLIGACDRDGVSVLADAARAACDHIHLIGEHLPEDPGEINASRLSGAWHLRVERMLRALLLNKKVDEHDPAQLGPCMDVLDPAKQGYDHASQMINSVESHDEDRLVWELLENGDDEDTARRKLALAWSIVATMPGQPMLYAGQEWGEHAKLVKDPNPLHWELLDTEGGRGLFEHHRRLCRLRREHDAIRGGHHRVEAVDDQARTAVYHRWHDQGDEVLVAANFSGDAAELTIRMPRPGPWKQWESDQPVDLNDDQTVQWTLSPWSAATFVRA